MFIAVGTINLVLLTVLGVLVLQIRGFVREAEERSSAQREKILHPLLDFEQIRSIPNLRDIELLLLSVVLLLVLYFLSIINKERLVDTYAHWWVAFEVVGTLVLCHALLRYTRHMVEQDNRDWHRRYDQTNDFRALRYLSLIVVGGVALWMALRLPSLSFIADAGRAYHQTEISSSSVGIAGPVVSVITLQNP